MNGKHLLVIHTTPERGPGHDEEAWSQQYNDILPSVVSLDSIQSAQRFKLSTFQVATILSPLPTPDEHQYLAIYEVDDPQQAAAVLAENAKRLGAHGTASSRSRYYDAISDRIVQ
jgi:hypothetical protein